ncbi:MAG: four helix bundle protein [Firmicutes bacterium]|nr:four helix bundle protein [Bacillota bacterium]
MDNIILEKSKKFAIRAVKLYQYLTNEKKEFILSKQLLKSGTSVGANVREAHNSMSKAEFKMKMNIALKEASETEYWLELLFETNYIEKEHFESIYKDCSELNKLLISIIKTLNKK